MLIQKVEFTKEIALIQLKKKGMGLMGRLKVELSKDYLSIEETELYTIY